MASSLSLSGKEYEYVIALKDRTLINGRVVKNSIFSVKVDPFPLVHYRTFVGSS